MFFRILALCALSGTVAFAAPAGKTAAPVVASFASLVPNSEATTRALVAAATQAQLAKSRGREADTARQHLREALARLGRPDVAMRYADEADSDDIWRTTAQTQAQLGDVKAARRALAKIEGRESHLNSLWAIARAQLRQNQAAAKITLLQA